MVSFMSTVLLTLVVSLSLVFPLTNGEYFDQYGNTLRHHANPRGNQRLHPDNHVQNYGYGRHADRYRNRFDEIGGGSGRTHAYNRRGEDYPRTVVRRLVTVTRVMY